jgi:hypothetical protein
MCETSLVGFLTQRGEAATKEMKREYGIYSAQNQPSRIDFEYTKAREPSSPGFCLMILSGHRSQRPQP